MRTVWLVVVLAAGCTSAPPGQVTPSQPTLPAFTTTTTPAPTRTERKVPGSCSTVITSAELDDLLEVRLSGGSAEVAGVPMPTIGRTARIDCYFGIPSGDRAAAALVVTLASYKDAVSAQTRIDRTLADERAQGASVSEIAVGPDAGYLIEGTARIVVARHGAVTVVVQATPALAPGDQPRRVLPLIADQALT